MKYADRFYRQADTENAIHKAILLHIKTQDKKTQCKSYMSMSILAAVEEKWDDAHNYCHKALKLMGEVQFIIMQETLRKKEMNP